MRDLLINPITIWIKWYFQSQKFLYLNRGKKIRLGYLAQVKASKVGLYATFYDRVAITHSIIDNYTYIGPNSKINNTSIGKFCSIGPDVKIGLGMHPTNLISTYPAFYSKQKQCQLTFTDKDYFDEAGCIHVGNDVWIGANVIVLDNVTIGSGAIIAAGAVVTKDVEPYSIVGGVPARLIKKRFSDSEIKKLIQIQWWNNDINWIRENHHYFNKPELFFKLFETQCNE